MLFWLFLRLISNYFYAKLSKHVTLSHRNAYSGIVQGSSHIINLRCLDSRSSTSKTTPECAANTVVPALTGNIKFSADSLWFHALVCIGDLFRFRK
jgi:hypothetical protein